MHKPLLTSTVYFLMCWKLSFTNHSARTVNVHTILIFVNYKSRPPGLCFSPHLTMCRGTLPYDLTTLPLLPGVSTLADLDAALPYFELIVESGCSARARQFVCPILEPECRPKGETLLPPCSKACKGKLMF
jgi:hypothetical protein